MSPPRQPHRQSTSNSVPLVIDPPSPNLSIPQSLSPGNPIIENELVSSTEELLRTCPKFRILVLGKSGAGKSSLINATFDVKLANESHEQSGVSNINYEITSEQNTRFILHDSQGFAAGETHNYRKVEEFIAERAEQPELKDQLHAIWFCAEIPTENGALFEAADEKFLSLSDMHNVPVVVVFTKFDLLVRKLEKLADDDVDEEELDRLVLMRAEEAFNETCVQKLKSITRERTNPISYVRVSKKPQYRDTLDQLVHETQGCLDNHISILWALAQRTSVDAKVNACIEVGRRKYWRGLASSIHFPGKTLEQCLNRIHDDMIDIWNFNDPMNILKSLDFKRIMFRIVEELEDGGRTNFRELMSVTSVAGVIGSVGIPIIAPAALAAAAGFVLAQWLFMIYQETPGVLRILMGYICVLTGLTTVLECLFWLLRVHGEASEVDAKFVGLAVAAQSSSGARSRIHEAIRSFVTAVSPFKRKGKDEALSLITNLIHAVKFKPEEVGQGDTYRLSMTISEFSVPNTNDQLVMTPEDSLSLVSRR